MREKIERFLLEGAYSVNTIAFYRYVLVRIGNDMGELQEVNPGDVRDWLADQDWSEVTQYSANCAIRSFARWAYGSQHGLAGMKVQRAESGPQRTLSFDQVRRMLESFDTFKSKGRRDLAMACLMLDSGIRAAEVCRLNLQNLDMIDRSFSVLIKGGKWDRGVFSAYTGVCLSTWLGDREKLVCQGVKEVFVSIGGNTPGHALNRHGLRAVVRNWGKQAGFGQLSPHDFRRTFATLATRLGAPSRLVQVAGRWSSIEMVERYTRVLDARDIDPWLPITQVMGEWG
jgi:integrase